MSIHPFLRSFLLLIVWLAAGAARAQEKPNIILILVDDLGWRDTGCYGSKYYQTPAIDRLAAEGVRFTDFYSAGPVCSPSRAALLTGRAPARLGITNVTQVPDRKVRPTDAWLEPHKKNHLALEEITIPEMLAPQGYVSGIFGKWHLGNDPYNPAAQGFQVSIAGRNEGSMNYFDPYKNKWFPSRKPGEYVTNRLTEEVLHFIDEQQEKPFFVYLAHFAVHIKLEAPADLIAQNAARIIPGDPQNNPTYAAAIQCVDDGVAAIVEKLRALQLDRKTILFFMSDNGAMQEDIRPPFEHITSNAPLREGKSTLYEGGLRQPLIAWAPGRFVAGAVCHEPALGTDFFQTIAALTHSELPKGVELDGRDLSAFCTAKDAAPLDRSLFWHFPHYTYHAPCAAIRHGPWKMIEFFGGAPELYNLDADLGEKNNLAASEAARTAAMTQELDAWLKNVGALLPMPNPAFDPQAAAAAPAAAAGSE